MGLPLDQASSKGKERRASCRSYPRDHAVGCCFPHFAVQSRGHGVHLVLVTRELGLPWVELVYGVALGEAGAEMAA